MAEAVFDLINLASRKAEEGKYEEALRILREKWAEISRSLEGQEREKFRSLVIATEADILSEINPEESAAKYEEALEIQERLLKKGVDDRLANWASVIHNNYGLLLFELRRYEEAEEHYKRAIELNPDLAEAHYNYGNMLFEQKRYKEAEEHYKRAIELNPDLAEAHNNYGNMLSELGRYDEAEEHYKRAIELNPDDFFAGMILYNLVVTLLHAERKVKNELREMALRLSKCKLFPEYRAEWTVRAAYLLRRGAVSSPDIEEEFLEYLMKLENEAEPEGGLQFLKLCRALLIRATRPFEAAALIGEASAWFRQKTGVDVSWTRSPTNIYYNAEVRTKLDQISYKDYYNVEVRI